ncbi:MAG: protein translocase subunit SecD [Gammaproteobacteria bacterium]|nr:protein translocase subunit SecD [Gammaproteobacteria bacterium]
MNQYPFWKYLLLIAVCVIGLVFASPNLFAPDRAVQISAHRAGAALPATLEAEVRTALIQAGIEPKRIDRGEARLLVRLDDPKKQLEASRAIRASLSDDFVVALNLAPTTPAWLQAVGALPMYLGLDLQGGVHFLMEVDMKAAVRQAENRHVGDIRTLLREARIRYRSVQRPETGGILVIFRDAQTMAKGRELIRAEIADLELSDGPEGQFQFRAALTEEAVLAVRAFALDQNITTLRNRVNELGVAEPVIQRQGDDRIVVQLPGVQDTAEAKRILGATATLEFRLVDDRGNVADAVNGLVPIGSKLYYERGGRPVLLERDIVISGDYIVDARSGIEQQTGTPAVFIGLDGRGADIMHDRTKGNVGRSMAVIFIDHKVTVREVDGVQKRQKKITEEVINVAVIRDRLGKNFQISGLDSTAEARDLALLLRAGALAAPIVIIEERTVGPSLGQESIDKGTLSVQIGFVLVLVFMAFYYRVFGLVANVALATNLVLIVAVLSMLQATLTLPGIAGIVLTVGMAVDANVLIFERIREELRNGNSPQASIKRGYEQAFTTIADANITTLIAAVVLFGFGTGPIKGFAVTLSIGILTSMFTAIMGTRGIVNLIYGGRRVSQLSI